jgi:general stress protein 26
MQPFEPQPNLIIWLGTSPKSRKVREIHSNDQVTLGYAYAQEGAYVTLTGTASIEDDKTLRQRFWRKEFADFWPSGPEDDDYALIKFVPSRIELMNIAQGVAPEPFGLHDDEP